MATSTPAVPLLTPPRRFSELGISSFLFSLLNAGAVCADLGVFAFLVIRHNTSSDRVLALLCVLIFFGILTSTTVGLAVGIAGLFQPDRLKIFAIFGAAINLAIMVGLVIVLVVASLLPGSGRLIDGDLARFILL